jgi:predicted acylesterase/phospholipase RssA
VVQQELLKLRSANDEQFMTANRMALGRLVERTKAEYDRYITGERTAPPVIDILVISGGGDWGAFGAGFLKGWLRVPAQHPLAKPDFDAVTGVSTGTLIAPFAFLGDEQSIDQIVNLYRHPQADWVKQRGVLYFLPSNLSFAEVPGLEREMRTYITLDMMRRIAKRGAEGRVLAVNTTNLDAATSRVFDLVAEAQRAADTGQVDRMHRLMLASAGIPAAFPFRIIDAELSVDGGVTGNIVYGAGRGGEADTLPAVWQQAYPHLPIRREVLHGLRWLIRTGVSWNLVPHTLASCYASVASGVCKIFESY